MKIAIAGFGREGQSALRFLRRSRLFDDSEFWVLDRRAIRTPKGVRAVTGKNYLKNIAAFDIVFRSPGIPYTLPEFVRVRKKGVVFSSLTKLFFAHCPGTVIGITGTKGKGTTATLLYKIMKANRMPVFLGGNIGNAALDILPKIKKGYYVILELSSFQLQDLATSPHIAAVLETFPDHQDAHKNFAEYYGAKANITRHQTPKDVVFFFPHNAKSAWIAHQGRGRKIAVDERKFRLFAPAELAMKGSHNFRNAAMAATIAKYLGVPSGTIARIAKDFPGTEHRLEFVCRRGNVAFYNDSASTNPHTTAAAISAFPEPHVLIAGGQDKGLDYAPLAKALKKSNTRAVILFGENKTKIEKAIRATGVAIALVKNLPAAMRLARTLKMTVVFSPGAASFDQFRNYADRGMQFKKLVRAIDKK